MDKIEFKKLLFRVAFCIMACDGSIDDQEIEELKLMNKDDSIFEGVDMSEELQNLVDEINLKGVKVVEDLFIGLRTTDYNFIQELNILEVALRIMDADSRQDENEIKFIHLLRSKLNLSDEMIFDKFGKVDILTPNEYSTNIITSKTDNEFIDKFNLLDISELIQFDFKNLDSK